MNGTQRSTRDAPAVWLIGDVVHSDFRDVEVCLRASCRVTQVPGIREAAERLRGDANSADVCLLFQSRPGGIAVRDIEQLQRAAPLAGLVAVLGSWCEGETRTGRPHAGVRRVYWYEFLAWWQQQLASWATGGCPEWALPATAEFGEFSRREKDMPCRGHGLVALETTCWETASALGDVLQGASFASAWLPPATRGAHLCGAVAGIWEGRQLDDVEAYALAAFCVRLGSATTPVIALLDFPRRDCCERALAAGAAVVLGKPWSNVDLIAAINDAIESRKRPTLQTSVGRAA